MKRLIIFSIISLIITTIFIIGICIENEIIIKITLISMLIDLFFHGLIHRLELFKEELKKEINNDK